MQMYLEHPKVFTDILHFVTVLAIPLHIFGTFCILMKTPKTMGSVKWIMLNFHCWCMVLDYGVTVLVVPLCLFPGLAGITYGVLSELGVSTGPQAYIILTSLAVVSASVITIFENRYFIVFAEDTKWKKYRYALSIFNYFFAATFSLPAYWFVPDQKMARAEVLKMIGPVPDYIRNGDIYVISLDKRTITYPCILIVSAIVPQAFVFITLMKKGLKKLRQTARFSETTLRMQRNFLYSVYIQIAIYMTSIQVPVIYVFTAILIQYYNQFANNLAFIIFSFNGLSSTIVMIYIHKPYRDYCFKLFKLEKFKKPVAPVESHVTIISVAPNVV